jgi:hypothetical protein
MDHGQRLGRAAPFLLLRRFRKTQRLKPQAIHPAPGQRRRDQAKQANCQAERPTFAAADIPTQYEVRVSMAGMLIRKLEP